MVKTWLYCCALMVILMITIGGLTRLSNAGLSIVEWKPVTGIIPPLSKADWVVEFSKYQGSSEYKTVNSYMSLQEFKHIFWLEFIHRIAARLTGLVICLPLLFFYLSGRLPFHENKSYILLPILLVTQGVMGWYMVKSGLVSNPHVSHFRLAAHMMLAVALYSMIVRKLTPPSQTIQILSLSTITLTLIYIQIFLGALVAGLDAGLVYNTFPLMGGHLVPEELYNAPSIFSDPASVQFMHRSMAYIVTISCLVLAYQRRSLMIFLAISLQVATGIITLLYNVPIPLALLHQLGAVILLSVILFI